MGLEKIGFIGLGTMGIPMCKSLQAAGYPLTVFNRNKAKAEVLIENGAVLAQHPAELITATDVVILMVTDDQAVDNLFNGENGLLSAGVSGKVIINMSTVSPEISKKMAALCSEQGNHYLDAPVSGSVKQANEATLIILVGSDDAVFVQVKPILEKIGKLAILFGGIGAGNKAKLIINTFLAIQAQSLAEAMVFAENLNLEKGAIVEVLNNSALGSPFVKIKSDAILNDNYAPAFTLNNIVKDLKLAKDIGLSTPLGLKSLETFENATASLGAEDIISIFKRLKE
ncbi:MAG: NAD(P)-dependent oxidoreductase [Bacteroidota bacterium]